MWTRGSAPERRRGLNRTRLARTAPRCLSLDNDNIFSRQEIAAFPGLVNIHPALPNLRGRGYDTLPNLEAHRDDGATLHVVGEDMDSGHIIEVISRPRPQAVADPLFRRRTQRLALELLETLLQRGRRTDPTTLAAELRHQAHEAGLPWSGERLTSRQLTAFLHNASRHQPRHPLFALLPHQLWH